MFEPSDSRNAKNEHEPDQTNAPRVKEPAVNVPSANNARTMSALASAFIICFTFASNTRYIVDITAVQ